MYNLAIEVIIQIMSYMYPLYIGTYIKSDIEYLNNYDYRHYKKIKKQCLDIISLASVCKYFNNIVRENGMKLIYFSKTVNIEVIKRYKSEYIIALNDIKFYNNKLTPLTNITYLNLWENGNITDGGIKRLTNLIHLELWENGNITDRGIKPLINLTYLKIMYNNKITDDGIKPLVNLTFLYLEHNKNITNEGIKQLPKLKTYCTYYINSNW